MLKRLAKWLVVRAQQRRARDGPIAREPLALIEPAPEPADFIAELERLLGEDDANRVGGCDVSGDGLHGDGGAGVPVQQSVLPQQVRPRRALTVVRERTPAPRGDLPRR